MFWAARLLFIFVAFAGGVGPQTSEAHPAPSSVLTLTLNEDRSLLQAQARVPIVELNTALGRQEKSRSLPGNIRSYGEERFKVLAESKALKTQYQRAVLDGDFAVIDFEFKLPASMSTSLKALQLDYRIVVDKVLTHDVMVFMGSNQRGPELVGTVSYDFSNGRLQPLLVPVASGSSQTFLTSLQLGVKHFRGGYDHILFLAVLLIVAPFMRRQRSWQKSSNFSQIVKRVVFVSLAFTVGHSLSLLAGSFISVASFSSVIETLIPVTIMLAAVHALRPLFKSRYEYLIVLGFGLIHGLAFSSELFNAEIGLRERIATTFAFNLGLELFQIAAIVVVLPAYLALLRVDKAAHSRAAFAALALLLASFWLAQRVIVLV